ncbi:MAG: amidohydrolase family protein, partial [Acidobacteria bacterium]|nr:amidohydrolase family protein [Acidobacteriota bacterium]
MTFLPVGDLPKRRIDAPRFLPALVCLWLVIASGSLLAGSLLIRGGTLIDGSGGPPVENTRILVEGNVIEKIWVGDAEMQRLPPSVQIIEAAGKFILPGLIDSHVHYRDWMGELFLAYGVTAVYDLGDPFRWQVAVKKGLNQGKIRGPRFYFCGEMSLPEAAKAEASLPSIWRRAPASISAPEEARRAVALVKGSGDCVKLNENFKQDLFSAVAREADSAGLAVISHSFNAVDSATWGIDGLEHMVGVALATVRSPEGRKAVEGMQIDAGHKNSALYQWMEPASFDEVINHLVTRKVFLNPTLTFEWKALSDRAREHELEDTRLLSIPELQYVPIDDRLVSLGQYHWPDQRSNDERKQFQNGYRKVQEFLRRFVAAGGKIYAGTDSSAATTPGLSLHHEMELLVDAGIPPMQAILAGSKYGAELLGLDTQIGTVEVGKLADLVVLGGDPLQDIRKTKSLEKVIKNGEILDIGYHSSHQIPFSRPGPESKHLYNP